MPTQLERRLTSAKEKAASKYGRAYVNIDDNHYRLNVVPTGSLMLDYKLGIGGFPYGHGVEVFGANQMGKSSAIGYPVLANVQKQGKLPALIAVEPRLVTPEDKAWARALGLEPDALLIQYPDNVEEAFEMIKDLVYNNEVNYIMVDSVGGMGTASESQAEGKKKAYGISGDVTSGLNSVMPRLYKNNIGLLLINQQRQSGSFNGVTLFDSPGGEALKHHMRVRIHLKPGRDRFTSKIDGEDVLVGRELVCDFKKNNLAQAGGKRASFNFYNIETEKFGFGIDVGQDVINTGKVTSVLGGGTWIEHHTFPAIKSGERKLNGKQAVADFLRENPKAMDIIRQEVMQVMIQEELEAAKQKREAEQTAKVETEINGSSGK